MTQLLRYAAPVVLAAGLGLSATAWAAPQPPTVQVTSDGPAAVVHATMEVAAPPAVVWKTLTDPASIVRVMVSVKSVRVLQSDPAGRWEVREQVTKGGLAPSLRVVTRADFQPYTTMRFHRIDGDIKQLDGEWKLAPLDGGTRTALTYDSRMTPPAGAPAFIVRAALRNDTTESMGNLRDASEAAAHHAP
jgi:carbon monoxide dehydrogenase subunit G